MSLSSKAFEGRGVDGLIDVDTDLRDDRRSIFPSTDGTRVRNLVKKRCRSKKRTHLRLPRSCRGEPVDDP